jgi:hypothetical protein
MQRLNLGKIFVRRRKLTISVLCAGLLATGTLVGAFRQGRFEGGDNVGRPDWKWGLQIAPVHLNLDGRNMKLVGEGSYLVNAVAGCSGCHTNPPFAEGGNPYLGQPELINAAGYLAGGMAFGPFLSRNITPDAVTGLPAGLTFKQFVEVIRTGVDPDNEHPQISPLLQVMPWPEFRKMSDDDLRAIYEYLLAVPHAEPVH